ncbi:organic cation transporter protein isoform X2 [Agrilus planipennis]|nr:organic cation transporter protein isoform X2 [Agrilus planipennis]XP_018333221.1 organic cation transporter protein isoform X2 [Agrilus planipennis]
MLTLVTVAAVPDHRCFIPELDANDSIWNITNVDLALYIPRLPTGEFDTCHIYNERNESMLCNAWIYDPTYHPSSRATEWDFVCHRRWMGAVAQSVYMFGVFTGAVVLGNMADKYGRKTIFCISAVLTLIFSVSVAFISNYYAFLVLRYFYGIFGSAGSYITGFVLTMELVGPSKRTACGVFFQFTFAIGIMMVAGWGALIKDRQILQVIYGLHTLLLIGHWWLMDESPRWLWMQGRTKEAVIIIKKGLKINGSAIHLDEADYEAPPRVENVSEESDISSGGISDLFRTPNLRKKTLNICLCWFANSLAYYGLSLSTGKLEGNPFLMLFLSGLVELPCYVLLITIMDRAGRRPLIAFYMITGGICCITAAKLTPATVGAISAAMIGKFLISSSFAIVYNYSAELFPTVIRNSALGLGSMCARLSGTLTPLVTLLDSFDPTLPAIVFAVIALISGALTLFLPETMGAPMPESIQDGEEFGKNDTCFTTCFRRKKVVDKKEEGQLEPLNSDKV